MSSKALARQRKAMWKRNPRCYYCGVVTILRPLHIPHEPLSPEIRDRVATLDHVRARHHPDRTKPPEPGEVLHVLSCWRCNNERDRRELREKPIEYLRQKCKTIPLEDRRLEELEDLLNFLLTRKPLNPHKRRRWECSLANVRAAIAKAKNGDQ